MTKQAISLESQPKRRFRFTIGTLLMWTAIIGLGATTLMTQQELRRLKQNAAVDLALAADRGLTAEDVAKRFEACTAHHPFPVTVTDIRYSAADDAYKVSFMFVDAAAYRTLYGNAVPTGEITPETAPSSIFGASSVVLESRGYGLYSGRVTDDAFLAPVENKETLWVTVKTPSPLKP